MAQLTRTDIIKLAELSALRLSEDEITTLLSDLQNIISYVDQLNTVVLHGQLQESKSENIVRADKSIPQESEPLLMQAPERFQDYFVVPKIVDQTKDAQ